MDIESGRIQNGGIDQNAMIGGGPGAWLDVFVTEATAISATQTKVTVTRKVVQRQFTGDKAWKTVSSNGKIERWLLTQVIDELKSPTGNEPHTAAAPAPSAVTSPPPSLDTSGDAPLTNAEVVKLVKAGFSNSVIIAKIKGTKET